MIYLRGDSIILLVWHSHLVEGRGLVCMIDRHIGVTSCERKTLLQFRTLVWCLNVEQFWIMRYLFLSLCTMNMVCIVHNQFEVVFIARTNLSPRQFASSDTFPSLTNEKALRWSNPFLSSPIAFMLPLDVYPGPDFNNNSDGYCASFCLCIYCSLILFMSCFRLASFVSGGIGNTEHILKDFIVTP